ncbi:aminotransferase-like domain-containing protein [Massiliimalia massiliensis]|uniref:aminotransferase-like domain-containing protein n=1 Tax=Massiliimalia massiliensis TaxID=1852384 RepID=UPI000986EF18|nr:PLP-dependent aminotransferase family protein [Massiliimalia massiliensis]
MNFNFSEKMGNLKASAIREILKFTADPSVISFAAGNPSAEAFPTEEIERIADEILTKTPIAALQYSITEGYTPLRETIKKVLLDRGETIFHDEFDDIIIMSGAQQGNELSCKVFCDSGDTLVCENPSFIGSLNSFKSYGVNLVGVPLSDGGIDLEKLENTLKENPNTKVIYLIPNFQNPTGTTMSYEKRKGVLELAKKYDVVILEDNPYGDLRFAGEHVPSIKSLDTEGRVIYCGSFSKILAPGLRVGYVVAHKEIIQKIVVCKQVSDVHTNILAQMICNQFLLENSYEEHLKKLRGIYRHKCGLMLDSLKQYVNPKITYTVPEGGLFVWCTLPDGVNMMEFCSNAVQNKVAVVPGNAFLPKESDPTQSFRLNFSTPSDEDIVKGIQILGELSKSL